MKNDAKSVREQAIRETKCTLILDAALRVFSEKGFHDTRLEDIALEAGFSKGALYNYFSDKEDIFLQLLIREHEALLKELHARFDPRKPIRESLESLVRATIEHFGDRFSFFVTIFNFRTGSPEAMANVCRVHESEVTRFRRLNNELMDLLGELFAAAKARKEIRTSIDNATLSRYVASLVRGTFMEWKILGAMGDGEQAIRDIVEFTLKGANACG